VGFKDECAVVGIFGHPKAARVTAVCLFALQHRGQEAAGIMTNQHLHKRRGLVRDVFTERTLSKLTGDSAIGHVRYSTAGGKSIKNAQPFLAESKFGKIGLAHNGNLTNTQELRHLLASRGVECESSSDSEVILRLITSSKATSLSAAVISALKKAQGAFSVVILYPEGILAARDPNGFRPLLIGETAVTGQPRCTIFASETCALGPVHASFIGEVKPGEVIQVSRQGICRQSYAEGKETFCIFEHVYFSRPDSVVDSRSEDSRRYEMGELLAANHPVKADVVIPVPDSGKPAALGFASRSGIPYRMGLVRNHYIGRTFIEPDQEDRENGVRLKLNPVIDLIKGQRVVLVDDSIVRGTTSRKIVRMVRAAGAKEVHLRIACPPTVSPCFYGVDTPTKSELIAANFSIEEICRFSEADSLGYLPLSSLKSACGKTRGYCSACYTGRYPTDVGHLINIP